MLKPMATSRKLGEHERLLNYLHAFGGLIVVQALHIAGDIDPARLKRGLAWTQSRHTMARAHIRYGGLVFRDLPPFVYRQPYFDTDGTKGIPLRVVTGDWRELMAEELRTPLKGGRLPRLRVTLVPESSAGLNHLLICADHAAIDAQSCNMLARELLGYLADPDKMVDDGGENGELPAPMETGLRQKSKSDAGSYEPAIRLPNMSREGGKPRTLAVTRHFPADEMAALKAQTLANRTSIHGALTAAFLLAMRDRYDVSEMTCLSTADLRRMCKPAVPATTFGCYFDILRTRHDIDKDFWALARDVSLRLISVLARDHDTASILKLPGWEVYVKEFWPTITHGRRLDGLAITTAGESGLGCDYGRLRLEDVTMAVSLDFFGPSMMAIASERAGGLDLSVCYATRALSTADAEDMTDRAISKLRAETSMTAANG